jgi:hypothetical protein
VNPRPVPRDTSSQDLQLLADIDYAVISLDQAFNHLSDRSCACLSRPYQRLAEAVLEAERLLGTKAGKPRDC